MNDLELSLRSGLRVVFRPDSRYDRVATCLNVRVGFRNERPGEEGLAHLVEHLVHHGGPAGTAQRWAQVAAGANATTHDDYTEFFQVLPATELAAAVRIDAQRLLRPRWSPELFDRERLAVLEEITRATTGRPFGGAPWPLLAGVTYPDHARGHDGLGDPAVVGRLGETQCRAFHRAHYRPSNAVLVIVGDFDPHEAGELVRAEFEGALGAEVLPEFPADRPERPRPTFDRVRSFGEAGVSTSLACVAAPLEDPVADPDGYLGALVLARALSEVADRAPLDAGCGFLGPVDVRGSDVLVVTSLGTTPQALGERVRSWLRDVPVSEATLTRARAGVHRTFVAEAADLLTLTRWAARTELLWGDPDLLPRWCERLVRLETSQVRDVAQRLAGVPFAALGLSPAQARERPVLERRELPERGPGDPARREFHPAACLPELAAVPTVRSRVTATQLAGPGRRVVVLPDDRSPHVLVRWRQPLGPAVWSAGAPAAVRVAATASQALEGLGGAAARWEATCDGETLLLAGTCAPDAVLAEVTAVLEQVGGTLAEFPRSEGRPPTPDLTLVADGVVRALVGGPVESPAEGSGVVSEPWSEPGGALLVVGPVPSAIAPDLARAWSRSIAADERGRGADAGACVPAEPVHVALAGTGVLDLRWWGRDDERSGDPGGTRADLVNFLVTAVLAGHPGSRAARAGVPVWATRTVVAGRPLRQLRSLGPSTGSVTGSAEAMVRALLVDVVAHPPGPAEVEAALDYCRAQLLSVGDSPQALVETTSVLLGQGYGAGRVAELSELLAQAGPDLFAEVTVAAVDWAASLGAPQLRFGDFATA